MEPIFSIDSWNVLERVRDQLPRSNNSLEGLHNALQHSLSCQHPTIWKLIEALKKEECIAVKKKSDFHRGIIVPQKNKIANKRVMALLDKYTPEDKIKFLKGIAHSIHNF